VLACEYENKMTAGENSLAAIIEACRRQDRASQKELYQLFYSYTLALAMRYLFSPDKKMRPFLGAGFATQWHPEYELEYEYTHLPSSTEFSVTLEVEALNRSLSFLHFEFGLS